MSRILSLRSLYFLGCILLAVCMPQHSWSQSANTLLDDLKLLTKSRYPSKDFSGLWLYISIADQKMYLINSWAITDSFIISTGMNGPGTNLYCTPTGLLKVCERYGDNLPPGAILKGRVFSGNVAKIYTDTTNVAEDDVTTRILRLTGTEPGKNLGGKVDTYSRYIYIHGTPEEGLLGKPVSHGCIRMTNQEIIDLYPVIPLGTLVLVR